MTEFGSGRTGEPGDDGDNAIEYYGKSFEALGEELTLKRLFLGWKITCEYLDELGLSQIGDDATRLQFINTLNRYVVSGMLLEASQKTDPDSIEAAVMFFQQELPDILQPTLGAFVPLFVARGIEFQANERNSEKVQLWLQEYALLSEATFFLE